MESQQTTKQSVETMARARYLDTLHNFDSWHRSSYKAGHPSIPLFFFGFPSVFESSCEPPFMLMNQGLLRMGSTKKGWFTTRF